MATFERSGVTIHYVVEGRGPVITLVHGFASSLHGNWRAPGIIEALVSAGRQVVALDCRGHGKSSKPHDPQSYAGAAMTEDVIALLDHLALAQVDLMGYSMGGWIAASLLVNHPGRFRSVILSGVGDGLLAGGLPRARSEAIANALDARDASAASGASARAFRAFAEQQKNDLAALAAMQRATRHEMDPARLGRVDKPGHRSDHFRLCIKNLYPVFFLLPHHLSSSEVCASRSARISWHPACLQLAFKSENGIRFQGYAFVLKRPVFNQTGNTECASGSDGTDHHHLEGARPWIYASKFTF